MSSSSAPSAMLLATIEARHAWGATGAQDDGKRWEPTGTRGKRYGRSEPVSGTQPQVTSPGDQMLAVSADWRPSARTDFVIDPATTPRIVGFRLATWDRPVDHRSSRRAHRAARAQSRRQGARGTRAHRLPIGSYATSSTPTPDRSKASGWEITRCLLTRRSASAAATPPPSSTPRTEPALAPLRLPFHSHASDDHVGPTRPCRGRGMQWHRSTLVDLRTMKRLREAGHNRAVGTEFGRLAR
jgi:hypothetical protein